VAFQRAQTFLTVLKENPTVAGSKGNLPVTLTSLTIAGTGFDTRDNGNFIVVELSGPGVRDGTPITTVTAVSSTQLTVVIPSPTTTLGLRAQAGGSALFARVISRGVASEVVQIGTVVVSPPQVNGGLTLHVVPASQSTIEIKGDGFNSVASSNTVALFNSAGAPLGISCSSLSYRSGVPMSLLCTLSGAIPGGTTGIKATVTAFGSTSSQGDVVTVVPSPPTVTSSTAALSGATFDIVGNGFDSNRDGVNFVTLSGPGTLGGAFCNTGPAKSPTLFTCQLVGSLVTGGGAVRATIVSFGVPSGASVQVGTA